MYTQPASFEMYLIQDAYSVTVQVAAFQETWFHLLIQSVIVVCVRGMMDCITQTLMELAHSAEVKSLLQLYV